MSCGCLKKRTINTNYAKVKNVAEHYLCENTKSVFIYRIDKETFNFCEFYSEIPKEVLSIEFIY